MKKQAQGKQFEKEFRDSCPVHIHIDRLEDGTGPMTPKTAADFILFDGSTLVYAELKSYQGDSIPMVKLTQTDDLVERSKKKNVEGVFFLNFRDHDKTIMIHSVLVGVMIHSGLKSMTMDTALKYGAEMPVRTSLDSPDVYDIGWAMEKIKYWKNKTY